MASYGQVIDSDYDPVKDTVYPLFTEYFQNPKLVKKKDVDKFSMYITQIYALLGVEFRYLIVFLPKDRFPIGSVRSLGDLQWVSLQTRTLTDEYKVPSHTYIPRRLQSLDKKIELVSKDDLQYKYKVEELPLEIVLLPKTKGLDYQPSGTVVTALETYQTLVTFVR